MVQITDSASYNRGPLTTVFQPDPTCYATLTVPIEASRYATKLYVGHGWDEWFDTSCFPTGTQSYSDVATWTAWRMYYYSPAVCPSDWHTGKVLTGTLSKDPSTSMTIGTDTSAILCCPSGYHYDSGDHLCASAISKGQTITYRVPTQQQSSWLPGTTVTTTFGWETTVSADGIVAMWQASDEAILAEATLTPLASPTSKPSNSTTSTDTSSSKPTFSIAPPTSSPTHRGSLSTASIAGIAVGLVVLVMAGLLLGFCIHRRRAKTIEATDMDARAGEPKVELSGRPVNELYAYARPAELRSTPAAHSGMHEMQ